MIFCIDGVDFSGKDTLAKYLKGILQEKYNRRVIITAYHHPQLLLEELPSNLKKNELVSTYIKETSKIVKLLKELNGATAFNYPETIQLLYFSIAPLYKKVIELLKTEGFDLILPRSWTSAYAYNQYQEGWIWNLKNNVWPLIDHYFFLDTNLELISNRKEKRIKTESETILPCYEEPGFLEKVNQKYLDLSKKLNYTKCTVLKAEWSLQDLSKKIIQKLPLDQIID